MKLGIIGGDHKRHLYFANQVSETFGLHKYIIYKREPPNRNTPVGIPKIDQNNFKRHFNNRTIAENTFFSNSYLMDHENYNNIDMSSVDDIDLFLVFGAEMIRDPLFSRIKHKTINLHLGLSPRYKGSATLFWPFYFLEPTFAGSTFHFITDKPDDGRIIHQSLPKLEYGDKIHDVACKVVIQSTKDIIHLLKKKLPNGIKQKSSGKLFLKSDFRPEHLRLLYNAFNDDIVDRYLSGEITCSKPKIYNTIR